MHVEIATLCHSAVVHEDNMSILDAFNRIIAPSFPHPFPPFSVAVRVRFESDEIGDHKLKVSVVDTRGRILGEVIASLHLASELFRPTMTVGLVVPISGTELLSGGEHGIDLTLDATEAQRTPFYVHSAE